MGVYTYTDPYTGQVINFEHAGNAPTDEDLAFMQQYARQQRDRVSSVLGTEYGDGTALGRSWKRGVAGLKGGIGELFESMGQGSGFGWLETLGSNMEDSARIRQAELGAQYGDPMRLEDVKGLGSGLSYLGELAGGSAPYMAGAALGAGAGALSAPLLGIGAGTAASLGAAATLFPTYVGENINRREENVGEDQLTGGDYLKATGTAAFQSALDIASLNVLARLGVGKPVLDALQGQVGQGFSRRLLTGAATGMGTEGSTEALQELAGMWQAGDDLSSPEAQRALAEAFIGGGVLGGVLGGAGRGAFGKRAGVSQEANEEEAPEQPAATPPQRPALDYTEPNLPQPELPQGIAGILNERGLAEPAEPDVGFLQSLQDWQQENIKPLLDRLKVAAQAPIRQRLASMSVSDPQVELQLEKYARTPGVKKETKDAINSYLMSRRAMPEPAKAAEPAKAQTTPMPVPAGPQTQVEQQTQQIAKDVKETKAKATKIAEASAPAQTVLEALRPDPTITNLGKIAQDVGLDAEEVASIVGELRAKGLISGVSDNGQIELTAAPAPKPKPKKVTKKAVQEQAKEVTADDAVGPEQPIDAGTGASPEVPAGGVGPSGEPGPARPEDTGRTGAPVDAGVAATDARTGDAEAAADGVGAALAPMAPDTAVPRQPYTPMSGAMPGAVTGTAGQNIPAPVSVPQPTPMELAGLATTTKVAAPQTEVEIREAERFLQQRREVMEPALNQQAQAALNAWWDKNVAQKQNNAEIAEIADTFASDATRKTAVDPSTSTDKQAVLKLLETADKKLSGPAKHAKTYFKWFYRPIDGLEWMVADAVLESGTQRSDATKDMGLLDARTKELAPETRKALKEMPKRNVKDDKALTAAEKRMMTGMSKANAKQAMKWVEENLSPQFNVRMRDFVRQYGKSSLDPDYAPELKPTAAVAKSITAGGNLTQAVALPAKPKLGVDAAKAADVVGRAREVEMQELRAFHNQLKAEQRAMQREAAKTKPTLPKTEEWERLWAKKPRSPETAVLEFELHPAIKNRLMAGDLQGALRMLQYYAPSERVARLAKLLAPYVEGIPLKYEADLKAPDNGDIVSGYYDYTNGELGINANYPTVETLLHEVVHAAVRTQIKNKSTPEAVRLKKLFEDASPLIKGEYGATNLDEFLAEALSNRNFQNLLASIHPNGKSVTAWDRLLNTIGNFVRRLLGQQPKSVMTAMDLIDEIAEGIIKAPGSVPGVGVMHKIAVVDGAKQALNAAARITDSVGGPKTAEFRNNFANDASRIMSVVGPAAARTFYGFLGLQPMVDIARAYNIRGGMELEKAIRESESYSMKSDQETDAVLEVMQKWLAKFPNQKQRFDSLVMRSTRTRVDPSHSLAKAERMYKGTDKWPEYQKLREEWNKLPPQGRELYVMMRDFYKERFKRMREAMVEKIDYTLGENSEEGARVKQMMIAKFMDMGRIEPYFPMARKGDFWLEYEMFNPDTNTTEPVKELFESRRAREQAAMQLDSVPGVVKNSEGKVQTKMYSSMDLVNRTRVPDSLFVKDTVDLIRTAVAKKGMNADLAADLQHDIVRMFIEALPETSFARSLQHRKDRLGAIEDSFEAFKLKGYTLGRQAVRHKYGHKVRAAADEIRQQAEFNNNQAQINVINELLSRADFAVNPPHGAMERFAQAANRTAFAYTLGFNVSSAVVNMSSVPIVVYPYLAGRYGNRASMRALNDAYRLFLNSKLSRTLELPGTYEGSNKVDVGTAPSIDNLYVLGQDGKFTVNDKVPADMRAELEELAPLVEKASQQGQLNRSIFYDSLGVESVGHQRTFADKVSAWSGGMFHFVERSNRQVTLMAAYKLELDRLRNRPKPEEMDLTEAERRDRAADAAIYQATETNGGSTLSSASRWSQRGIGRVALMFKNYGLQMAYLQAKLIRKIVWSDPNLTPEERKEAIRQLAGLQLSSAALAGVAGVPLYGIFSTIFDIAVFGDDEEDSDMVARRYLGEAIFKGLPSYLTGMDVSSRVGLTGLLIRENRYNTNPSDEERVVQNLGGPAWSTFTQVRRGITEFGTAIREGDDEAMLRGIENMIPAAIRNFSKAARYAYEGGNIDTRRGDIITGDLGLNSILGQAFGFAPMQATLQQDINRTNVRISRAVNDKRSRLTKRYYLAMRMGDREGMQDAIAEIQEFNRDMAGRYPEAIISAEDIKRSVKGHERTTKEMSSGVSLAPNVREPLNEMAQEYGRPLPVFLS